ncbi:MAG: sigma-70 family RNA polymerase sigma factor [Deltaproteobacteria bacterium]|nr:MAG: sigma-70 family RNA polymerase sigma factor [Deltaproteobacteria bacterium]
MLAGCLVFFGMILPSTPELAIDRAHPCRDSVTFVRNVTCAFASCQAPVHCTREAIGPRHTPAGDRARESGRRCFITGSTRGMTVDAWLRPPRDATPRAAGPCSRAQLAPWRGLPALARCRPCASRRAPRSSRDMADDAELLQRWRDGDGAAGNQLFERCFAPIYRFFINKTRSPADTEELTQNTFVALMSAREGFLGRSSFLTYALGVASNVLRHYYRSLAREAEQLDPLASSIVALGAGAQTQLECAEAQQLLLVALREIPAELQIVLELYYVESLDPAAIGETLGLNANTVRGRIQRGRDQLRAKLDELATRAPDAQSPDADAWPELIRSAFPARILTTAFTPDS